MRPDQTNWEACRAEGAVVEVENGGVACEVEELGIGASLSAEEECRDDHPAASSNAPDPQDGLVEIELDYY